MADTKISALPSATTPLAGTEVVPLVQSGVTKKVAVSDLTTSSTVTVSNDTSTATDLYPTFLNATTGTASTIYTGNAKLLYKPSTGELKATAPIALNGIVLNNTTVATSYTIATGVNGMSVGPVTVNSGITVTVSSGQRWLVL